MKWNCPPPTEANVVYDNNHDHCNSFKPEHRDTDLFNPLNVINIDGSLRGFSWNYDDSVELDICLNDTILHSDRQHLGLFKKYLNGKKVEINFIDMRGEAKYSFCVPASLHVQLKLNYSDDTLIERNEYSCTLVLINPYDNSRINLLKEPYRIYVK